MPVLDSLAHTVASLGIPGGVRIERRDGQLDAFGNPQSGVLRRFTFRMNPAIVQIATGRDLERLLGGDRDKETLMVHTRKRLRTALGGTNEEADTVIYCPGGEGEDRRYTVTMAADWAILAGFFAVLAVKQEQA